MASRDPVRVVLSAPLRLMRAGVARILDGEDGVELCAEADGPQQALRHVQSHSPDVLLFYRSSQQEASMILSNLGKASPSTRALALMSQPNAVQVRQLMRRGARGAVCLAESESMMLTAISLVARGDGYINPVLASEVASLGDSGFPRGLTEREAEVLQLVALGYTNHQIADRLYLSVRTVEVHRANIINKLDSSCRRDLVAWADKIGLLPGSLAI